MPTKKITAVITVTAVWLASLTVFSASAPVATAAAAASASASASAESWARYDSLSGSSRDSPELTVDSTGRVTAVWLSQMSVGRNFVEASTLKNGGSWSRPVIISDTDSVDSGGPVQIASDSSGRAIAIWSERIGTTTVVQSSSSLNGAAWTDPVPLSDPTQPSWNPQITVDATGRAIAVWLSSRPDGTFVQSSTSESGGAWSAAPDTLSAPVYPLSPQITVSATGLATAIWVRLGDGGENLLESSTSQNGGDWSAPTVVSDQGTIGQMQITASAAGLATAVWVRFDTNPRIIQSSTSQNGGNWSAIETVSDPTQLSVEPQIAVSATGLATAVWIGRESDRGWVIQVSTSLNGGKWTTPIPISEESWMSNTIQIAVDQAGRATAVWGFTAIDYGPSTIQTRTSHNGGGWSDVVTLSDASISSAGPQIAVGLNGAATTVWSEMTFDGGIGTAHSMTPFATTTVPTLVGVAKVGQPVTAHMSRWWTWSPTPTTLTYAWKRSDTGAVVGTDDTYVPTVADTGATLIVTATAERAGYAPTEVTSAATATVAAGTFSITGTAQVGARLTAPTGTWPQGTTLTYAWKRSGVARPISTAAEYTPVSADIAKTLTVTVTAKRTGASTITATSAATTAVLGLPFTTSPVPTITTTGVGSPTVGTKLTAMPGIWAPSTSVTFSYVWKRASSPTGPATVIPRATLKTYTAVAADRGMYITVSVTAKKTGYATTTVTSASGGMQITSVGGSRGTVR